MWKFLNIQVELQVRILLGLKTEADLAPKAKPVKEKKKETSVKEEKKVEKKEEKRDDEEGELVCQK